MNAEVWPVIFWLIALVVTVEILLHFWVGFVRSHFQWLITEKDEFPILSEDGLKKFISSGYDPELGWDRKPNTSHQENGKYGTTTWNIDSNGSRLNPDFEGKNSTISCYGDSFTFCRQVNDNETWEHFLSKFQNTNVQNFAVGNHGIDQSMLKMKKVYPQNKTDIVILAVVPDTISRIMSYWKHYYEYGNTFAFKPRFILQKGSLHQLNNKIDQADKFKNYKQYLEEIRNNDFFYKRKFKKEKIHFPYIITILKNYQRNLPIIFWVTIIQFLRKMNYDILKIDWNPLRTIMRINLKWRIRLFRSDSPVKLLEKIIENFTIYAKKNNFIPILIFLPQKDDLLFIKQQFHFYENFLKQLTIIKDLHIIDVTKPFLEDSNIDKLYSDDNEYGGHYSKFGNQKVANIINDELIKLDIVKKRV